MDVEKSFMGALCAVVAIMICVILSMGLRKNPEGKRMYITLATMMFMQYAIWVFTSSPWDLILARD